MRGGGRNEGDGRNETRTHRYMWAASRRPPRPSRVKISFPRHTRQNPRAVIPSASRKSTLFGQKIRIAAKVISSPCMQRVSSRGLAPRGPASSVSPPISKDLDRTRETPVHCLRIVSEMEMSSTHQCIGAQDRLRLRRACPRDSTSARAYPGVLLLLHSSGAMRTGNIPTLLNPNQLAREH